MSDQSISCGIAQDLMPLVIDDAAGAESKKAVEAHLSECRNCAQLFESLKQADPVPEKDAEDGEHFKKTMKRISRRSRAVCVVAVCLAALLIAGIIKVATNQQMLLSIHSEAPVEWMENARLVRSAQNIVMLRFTPSEKYRAFFGV